MEPRDRRRSPAGPVVRPPAGPAAPPVVRIQLIVGVALLALALGALAWALTGLGVPDPPAIPPTTTVCHMGRCS